jgi:hypothetical protein
VCNNCEIKLDNRAWREWESARAMKVKNEIGWKLKNDKATERKKVRIKMGVSDVYHIIYSLLCNKLRSFCKIPLAKSMPSEEREGESGI